MALAEAKCFDLALWVGEAPERTSPTSSEAFLALNGMRVAPGHKTEVSPVTYRSRRPLEGPQIARPVASTAKKTPGHWGSGEKTDEVRL